MTDLQHTESSASERRTKSLGNINDLVQESRSPETLETIENDIEDLARDSLVKFEKKQLREIDQIDWKSLNAETLNSINHGIDQRRLKLANEMEDSQLKLGQLTTEDTLDEFRRTRVHIRRKRREFNRLGDYQSRVVCEREEKVISDRKEKLLSARGARLLDVSVRLLIFVVLGILTLEMFFYDQLKASGVLITFFVIDLIACTVFQYEFWLGHRYAESKRWYWKHHWIDFASSIPIPDPYWVSAHQWARLLRLVRVFRLWRAVRILAFAFRGAQRIRRSSLQAIELTLILIVVFTVVGAAAMLTLEGEQLAAYSRNSALDVSPGLVQSNQEFEPAVLQHAKYEVAPRTNNTAPNPDVPQSEVIAESAWWTFTTVTTGGFADLYPPQSTGGRMLTGLLILAGAGLIAVFTATITTVFMHGESDEFRDTQDALLSRHDDLERRLKALQETVRSLKISGA